MDIQKYFLLIFSSVLALVLLAWLLYLEKARNEDDISSAVTKRYQSFLLADELRQSSDDLTRMARLYVVTGNPKYKEYFDRILAIRNGQAPRPLNYHNVYWDFIVATGVSPRVDTEAKPLKQLMREADFSETEFALLQETEEMSDELVSLEARAMNAMVGIFQDSSGHQITAPPDRELARNLLHSEQYNEFKQRVMTPLKQFIETVDYRTSEDIAIHTDKQRRLNFVWILTMGLATFLVLCALGLTIIWVLKTKSTALSKSKLARRLVGNSYTGSETGDKRSERDALIKRLTSRGDTSSGATAQGAGSETMSFRYFLKIFWNSWPLVAAALFVAVLTLGISWELLSDNRIRTFAKTRTELKFSLDNTMRAVESWLAQMSQDTARFAYTIKYEVPEEDLQSLKSDPHHRLHQRLTTTVLLETEDMSGEAQPDILASAPTDGAAAFDHIVVNAQGVILSSNNEDLIGRSFTPSAEMMARIMANHVAISFPDHTASDELLAQNIVFGALIDDLKGAVFIIAPPQQTLTKILRRGYIGNYGEVYLVDGKGRFISEPRWQEELLERRNGAGQSVIGSYANQSGAETAALPFSVRAATRGEINPALQEYDSYLGEKVVGLWEWNNTYGFGLINEFKSKDALATFRAFRTQAIAGSGLTVALFLILTLVAIWGRYRITRSNEQLKGAIKTIKSNSDKIAADLRIGQKVQMDMLPDPIEGDGFTLDAFLKPALSVSGDFYDFSVIKNNKVYFCLGDVSGKGVPAALFMSVTISLLNKVLDQSDQTRDIINRVNNELCQNNDSNMFVTLIIGIMDMNTGELLLTNAGHNLPYIKKHNGEVICLEQVHGPLVGTFEGIEFQQQTITMEAGDIVMLYTDGVTEALNIRDEFYEDERLQKLLEDRTFGNAHEMTNGVYRNVLRFIGRAEQFDDITILSFQYNGSG